MFCEFSHSPTSSLSPSELLVRRKFFSPIVVSFAVLDVMSFCTPTMEPRSGALTVVTLTYKP